MPTLNALKTVQIVDPNVQRLLRLLEVEEDGEYTNFWAASQRARDEGKHVLPWINPALKGNNLSAQLDGLSLSTKTKVDRYDSQLTLFVVNILKLLKTAI